MNETTHSGEILSPRKKNSPHAFFGRKQTPYLYLLDILNVFKHLTFPFIMAVMGLVAFCFVAPGKDMMHILGTDTRLILQWPAALFTIWWSTTLWYGSRVLLHHCQIEYIHEKFNNNIQKWAPRIIGMLAFLDVLIGLMKANEKIFFNVIVLYIGLGGLTLLFLIKRRSWFGKFFKIEGIHTGAIEFRLKTFFKDWPFVTFSFILFILLFILILISPVNFTRKLNPIGIILTAFAGWSMLGLFIKIIDKVIYLPLLTLFFLLAFFLGKFNFNNTVPRGLEKNNMEISSYFDKWHESKIWKDTIPGDEAVFIVTAEGGASRSAYWTGKVLTALQEKNPAFYDHIFALTSVSGGSLGTSSFFVLMESLNHAEKPLFPVSRLTDTAEYLLSRDYLSPVTSGMLYPNLIQQFLPFKSGLANRANFLEKSWLHEWEKISPFDFTQPFNNFWNKGHNPPLLVFNTTHVESGKRAVISYAKFHEGSADLFDVLHLPNADANFTLQKAVSTSAAFPYISPSTRIQNEEGIWGNLVDGGYFENSGVYTAIDIYNNIKKSDAFKNVKVYFIVIRAFPDGNSYDPDLWLNEAADPMRAIFNTRAARSPHSNILLKNLMGAANIFTFQLNDYHDVPVNWYISERGIQKMDSLFEIAENTWKIQHVANLITH